VRFNLKCFSTLLSRILSIYLFGYWEIPSCMFLKFWKKKKKKKKKEKILAKNGCVGGGKVCSDIENSIIY
jgi:antibiotic biosynthesis monooxygenase (ABM) superfamily enzyme